MKYEGKKLPRPVPPTRTYQPKKGPVAAPSARKEDDSVYSENAHPDDRASMLESMALGVAAVDRFAEDYAEELRALIWTYGDGLAEEKLAALREIFWGTNEYIKSRSSS